MGRRVRKIGRVLAVATPLAFFSGWVFWLSIFPWAVERGLLAGITREHLGTRVFHSGVTYDRIRIDGRRAILENVQIESLRDAAEGSSIRRAVLHFDRLIPFGRIERIEFEGMKIRFDVTRDKLAAILDRPRRDRERATAGGATPEPAGREPRSSWLATADLNLGLGRRARMPTIEIQDAELEGTFGDRPYRIVGLEGIVRNVDGSLVPFNLHGTFADSGEPAIFRGRADFRPERGELKFSVRLPGFQLDVDLDSGRDRATLDAATGPIRIGDSLRSLLQGIDISGTARTTLRVTTRDGRWDSVEIRGALEGYRIGVDGAILESAGTTQVDLQLHPEPEGAAVRAALRGLAVRIGGRRVEADSLDADLLLRDEGGDLRGASGIVTVRRAKGEIEPGKTTPIEEARLSFDVRRPDTDRVQLREGELTIPSLGTLRLSGEAVKADKGWRIRGRAAGERLDVETMVERAREWRGLSLRDLHGSGRIDAAVDVDDGRIEGRMALTGVTLHYKGILLRRLDGMVSLDGDGGGFALFKADAIRMGPLRIEQAGGRLPLREGEGWFGGEASLGDARLGRLDVKLRSARDRIELPEGIKLAALGGTIELGPLTVFDPFDAGRRVETSLRVEGVKLEEILEAVDAGRRVEGRVEANFARILLGPERAELGGGSATLRAFGGKFELHELAVERPMGPEGEVAFGATMENVSMRRMGIELKDAAAIHGAIEGSMRGRIKLETRRPETLELTLRSVETRGEERLISLRGIRRIMIAGGDVRGARRLARSPIGRVYYGGLGLYARIEEGKWFTVRGKFYRAEGGKLREYAWEELRAGRVEPGADELIMVGAGRYRLNVHMAEPGARVPLDLLWERLRREED